MKISKKIIMIMCISAALFSGCSKNDETIKTEDNKEVSEYAVNESNMKEIENHIPYIDEMDGSVHNEIIDERYKNVNKEELTYNPISYSEENSNEVEENQTITEVYSADSIKEDRSYKNILLGFTYTSEGNPTSVSYDEAEDLVKKVLPDDIKKVKSVIDEEVNKEYIYYKSEKGNFRVGLCYGYVMTDEGEKVDKDLIVGIDYSKEI